MTACGFERSEETQLPELMQSKVTACGFERSEETQLPELMHASGFSRESQGEDPSYLRTAASSCLRIANPGSNARKARRVPPSPRKRRAREGGTS